MHMYAHMRWYNIVVRKCVTKREYMYAIEVNGKRTVCPNAVGEHTNAHIQTPTRKSM